MRWLPWECPALHSRLITISQTPQIWNGKQLNIDWDATSADGYTPPWSTSATGTAATTAPGAGDNVYVGPKYIQNAPTGTTYEMISIAADKTIANLNVYQDASPSYSAWIMPGVNGAFNFTVTQDFNVTSSASNAKAFTIRSHGTAQTLNVSVGGNVKVTGSAVSALTAIFGADNNNYNLKGLSVGKDFTIDTARVNSNFGDGATFDVAGTLNMLNDSRLYLMQRRNKAGQVTVANVNVNFGGISGTGIISSGTTATVYDFTSTAKITLKNTGKTTFSGIFQDNSASSDVSFSLVMKGSDTGKQTLILADTSSIKGGISVKSGTLSLYTSSSIKGDIELNAGTFEAYSNGGVSQVLANSFYWNGGKFSIGSVSSDNKIVAVAQLSGDFCGSIDSDAYGLVYNDLSGVVSGSEYKLVSWSGTASDFDEGLISDNASKLGYDTSYRLADKNLYVTFTSVPEPAAIALIFGACALATAWRRRK